MVRLQHEIQEAVDPKRLFPEKLDYHSQDYNQIMVAEDPILAVLKGAWADICVFECCPSSCACSIVSRFLSPATGAVLYGKNKDSVRFFRKSR